MTLICNTYLLGICSCSAALGVIDKWYKKEGDLIKRDEVICDIRTEVGAFLVFSMITLLCFTKRMHI